MPRRRRRSKVGSPEWYAELEERRRREAERIKQRNAEYEANFPIVTDEAVVSCVDRLFDARVSLSKLREGVVMEEKPELPLLEMTYRRTIDTCMEELAAETQRRGTGLRVSMGGSFFLTVAYQGAA